MTEKDKLRRDRFVKERVRKRYVVPRLTRDVIVKPIARTFIVPGEDESLADAIKSILSQGTEERKWQGLQRKIDEWWICNPKLDLSECPYLESAELLWEDYSELAFIVKYTTKEKETAYLWIKTKKQGSPYYLVHHVAQNLLEMIRWHNIYKRGFDRLGYRVKVDGAIELVGQPK